MASHTKIHRNLVEAIVRTLHEIFVNQRYADKAVEYTLQSNKKWGARDRAFIAENTYEIVRWWRLLSELGGTEENHTQNLWKIFGTLWVYKGYELPEWKEFESLNRKAVIARYEKIKTVRSLVQSIPDWLDELGAKELPDRWEKEIHQLNEPAEVVIRANTLKTTRDKLFQILYTEGIETKKNNEYPDALILLKRQNIFASPSFKSGLFEVQDASSQRVAPDLGVEPGMRVVDACAGAGGKTLHIAALMKNKGRIIAMDTEEWKLNNLRKRASRAGISIIETRLIDSSKTIKRLYNTADRLLLDVPCSGLGVIRRNPDAKWKLNSEFIEAVRNTQQEILRSYAPIVKEDGQVIYSTCSILPSENSEQIKKFLSSGENSFEWVHEKNIYPSETGYDGFYISKLMRKQ